MSNTHLTLPSKRYREVYEHLVPGTTVRRNHEECTSGEDVRRRLYITKSEDNQKLRCFCHNCGLGTVIDMTGAPRLRKVTGDEEPEALVLPPRWDGPTPIHPRHKLWLDAYGIGRVAEDSGAYSTSEYELVFPYQLSGARALCGYQIRYFDGRKPKWKSRGTPTGARMYGDVIVTEDIVSSLKWWASVSNSGYVSLGGHRPSLPLVGYAAPTMFVVWLDNDKESVIKAAESLAAECATLAPTVLISGGTDPKRYPKSELKKVSDDCKALIKLAPADGRSYHVLKIWNPGEGVCS